jgi:hypothetical protein
LQDQVEKERQGDGNPDPFVQRQSGEPNDLQNQRTEEQQRIKNQEEASSGHGIGLQGGRDGMPCYREWIIPNGDLSYRRAGGKEPGCQGRLS